MSKHKQIQAIVLYATPVMRERGEVDFEQALASAAEAIRDRCAQTGRRVVGSTVRILPASQFGSYVFGPDDVYLVATADTVLQE